MRKLLIERYNCAGTDEPCYYDEATGFEIEADYENDDAFPFGYFPVDPASDKLEFLYGDRDWDEVVHGDIFRVALGRYIEAFIFEEIDSEKEERLFDFFDKMKSIIDDEGLEYNRWESDFTNNKGDCLDFVIRLREIFQELGINIFVNDGLADIIEAIIEKNDWERNYSFAEELQEAVMDYGDDAEDSASVLGINTNEVLLKARLLGRMWTEQKLITFYPGQQPSRAEMEYVVRDLAKVVKYWTDLTYEDILNFYTIFEVGSKIKYSGTGYHGNADATVQCCTVADYIAGKYNGFNREDEIEMVKNRKGIESLNIHLADQNKKREALKGFRDTRDQAVYVPREKVAGNLAAYHAMRYPFGENTIKESSGYETHKSFRGEAGTDFPHYYDKKTGIEYSAWWQDSGAFPFGFWSLDGWDADCFSIGDESHTHANACGKVAKEFVRRELLDNNNCYYIQDAIENVLGEIEDNGWKLSDDEKYLYVIDDTGNAKLTLYISDWADDICGELEAYFPTEKIIEAAIWSIKNGKAYPSYKLAEWYKAEVDHDLNDYEIDDGEEVNELFDQYNIYDTFDDFFYNGKLEGRIWTESEMMGFYEEEQPTSTELDDIIRRLDKSEVIPATYDEMMKYMIIYYGDKDDEYGYHNEVTGCTVYEYIHGAPMDDKINPDERQGRVFIPHLAKPEEKREFFKDFRDARDRAIFVPREKGAGSLAAYHAMRYPYAESRTKKGKKVYINESRITLLKNK